MAIREEDFAAGKGILTHISEKVIQWQENGRLHLVLSVFTFVFPSCLLYKVSLKKSQPRAQVREGRPVLPLYHIHSIRTVSFTVSFRLSSNESHPGLLSYERGVQIPQQRSDDTEGSLYLKVSQLNARTGSAILPCHWIRESPHRRWWLISLWLQIWCLESQITQLPGRANMTQLLQTFPLSWWYSLAVFNHDSTPLEPAPSALSVYLAIWYCTVWSIEEKLTRTICQKCWNAPKC